MRRLYSPPDRVQNKKNGYRYESRCKAGTTGSGNPHGRKPAMQTFSQFELE